MLEKIGLKKYDAVVILLSVIGIMLSLTFVSHGSEENVLMIYADGKKQVRSLSDARFTVKSSHGKLDVKVEDGKVRVVDTSCPDRWCMQMGPIYKTGDSIVCLPSKIFIYIESKKKAQGRETDGITR